MTELSLNQFAENNKPINEEYCIHGMLKSSCAYCNGLYEHVNKQKRERQEATEELKSLKRNYDAIKGSLKNHWELWTEEEYVVLFDKLRGISSIRSLAFRKAVYEVATQLERTRLSIVWHYKHLFRGNYKKGGHVLEEFAKKLKAEGKL